MPFEDFWFIFFSSAIPPMFSTTKQITNPLLQIFNQGLTILFHPTSATFSQL
jgi:hypothetical protein